MTKFTEKKLEEKYDAVKLQRDALRQQATDNRFAPNTRLALARAADATANAMLEIQVELRR